MKNYRYQVLRENIGDPISTHRNPAVAFAAALRLAESHPPFKFGFKDIKAGGFFIAQTPEFDRAFLRAIDGDLDFLPVHDVRCEHSKFRSLCPECSELR